MDYRGHGLSSGNFENGTIGDWADDALQVIDRATQGPLILVGSSMGGWIALLVAKKRPRRVAGLLGIAAAPDFTEDLIRPLLQDWQKDELARLGKTYEDDKRQGAPITQKLMEDGAHNLVLREALAIPAPVRLLQGKQDRDVPWRHALKIAGHVQAPDLRLTLVEDADHRWNRPQDLALIRAELCALRGGA
jgi:pimeloyl-ACP methyl ester carboxylesterase